MNILNKEFIEHVKVGIKVCINDCTTCEGCPYHARLLPEGISWCPNFVI